MTVPPPQQTELRCSAKGCRASAHYGIRWNNPALHDAARRKVWLACDDHRAHLEDFLRMRNFYRDCVPVAELDPQDG